MFSTHNTDNSEVDVSRELADGLTEMHASAELKANFDMSKVTSFYQLLTITTAEETPAFLFNMIDSNSFRDLLENNDILMILIQHFLTPEMIEEALIKIGKEKLRSLIITRHNLIELLQLLPLNKRGHIMNFIGIDFVKKFIAMQDGESESFLGALLGVLKPDKPQAALFLDPNSVAWTFLCKDLGLDYVRGLANSTKKLHRLINGLVISEQIHFLKWLGVDFIIGNMKNIEEIDLILLLLNRPKDRFDFLMSISVEKQKGIYHNSEKLIRVLETLYKKDRFIYVKFLGENVLSKICTDKYIVDLVSKCFSEDDRLVFIEHSGFANELLSKVTVIPQADQQSDHTHLSDSIEQLALPNSTDSFEDKAEAQQEPEGERYDGYLALKMVFDNIIRNLPERHNQYTDSFNENIILLKDHVMNASFDFTGRMSIAQSCRALVAKVSLGTVTQSDCTKFFNETIQFHIDKTFEVIVKTILGAITGMLLATSVGFLAGNVLGAAIGAGIGFFAGGLSAAAIALESKNRQDVFVQVYRDARNLLS